VCFFKACFCFCLSLLSFLCFIMTSSDGLGHSSSQNSSGTSLR
jgi:hypothetical protein